MKTLRDFLSENDQNVFVKTSDGKKHSVYTGSSRRRNSRQNSVQKNAAKAHRAGFNAGMADWNNNAKAHGQHSSKYQDGFTAGQEAAKKNPPPDHFSAVRPGDFYGLSKALSQPDFKKHTDKHYPGYND